MKILNITPYPPYPPQAGGRIRMWEQIKYLGARHRLTVVSFIFSDGERDIHKVLKKYCEDVVLVDCKESIVPEDSLTPKLVYVYDTKEMRATLDRLRSRQFDVALVEHIFMAQYYNYLDARRVLQEHNIESEVLRRSSDLQRTAPISDQHASDAAKAFLDSEQEWPRMADYEDRLWPEFPLRITVSERDKEAMDLRCPFGKTIVVENGTDTRSVSPFEELTGGRILFMGTMDYYPNIDAVLYLKEAIMSAVWSRDPSIRLCVAGRNPPPEIENLACDPRVVIYANPPDMRDVARECSLTIVPLRIGGGTRIKILDAMSMGLPVISTTLGCEGLDVEHGTNILIADEPGQIADFLIKVNSDQVLRNTLRTNGRALVERQYDWQLKLERLEAAIVSPQDINN
jgi:glycosyltransferase involved in cell wall biosynthesis